MSRKLPLAYEWTKTVGGAASSPAFTRPYLYFIHVDESGKVLYNRPSTETRVASYAPDERGTFSAYEERRFDFHDPAGGFAEHFINLGDNKTEDEVSLLLNAYIRSWINGRFSVKPTL